MYILVAFGLLALLSLVYYIFITKGIIKDENQNYIPDSVDSKIEDFNLLVDTAKESIEATIEDLKETAFEIKRRAKNAKEEMKDVVEELKDVTDAIKGK